MHVRYLTAFAWVIVLPIFISCSSDGDGGYFSSSSGGSSSGGAGASNSAGTNSGSGGTTPGTGGTGLGSGGTTPGTGGTTFGSGGTPSGSGGTTSSSGGTSAGGGNGGSGTLPGNSDIKVLCARGCANCAQQNLCERECAKLTDQLIEKCPDQSAALADCLSGTTASDFECDQNGYVSPKAGICESEVTAAFNCYLQ